jgi:thiol-disulfide isomerase/thioredoxin
MNDRRVMGVVCPLNKLTDLTKRFFDKLRMTIGKLEVTIGWRPLRSKSLMSCFLCLVSIKILFCVCLAHARQQGLGTPVAIGVALSADSIKPLQIGDSIPSVLWNLPLQMIKAGQEGSTTIKLRDYGDKLIILDFWATWCSPCIAMIPKMDTLQNTFDGQLQFISCSSQKNEVVLPFIGQLEKRLKQRFHIPLVNGHNPLYQAFPHVYLPHYVWIYKGKVRAVTALREVNEANIKAILNDEDLYLPLKLDEKLVKVDRAKPLFTNGNGGTGSTLQYISQLSNYTPGLSSSYNLEIDSMKGDKIALYNMSLHRIYAYTYGERYDFIGENRIFLKIKEPDLIRPRQDESFKQWRIKHAYCYELKVPPMLNDRFYQLMQDDLARLFPQYQAKLKSKRMRCLALVRTSKRDKIRAKPGQKLTNSKLVYSIENGPISNLIDQLNIFSLYASPIPIVDATGYKDFVTLTLDCNLSKVSELNRELAKYDLQLKEMKRKIKVLEIKDTALK